MSHVPASSFYQRPRRRLAECDWIGLHHLALKVEDFAAATAMRVQHFVVAQTGQVGQATEFCYFDTVAAMGHYTEVVYLDWDFRKTFDAIARNDSPRPAPGKD